MKLSEVAIQRPVFATVMSLTIILLGYISFTRLPVREYPETDPPIVSVTTIYRGASPNVVETEITDVLEEQFAEAFDVNSTEEIPQSIAASAVDETGAVVEVVGISQMHVSRLLRRSFEEMRASLGDDARA